MVVVLSSKFDRLPNVPELSSVRVLFVVDGPDFNYCVADISGAKKAASPSYLEWQMYDQKNAPHELVNLAGRKEYAAKAKERKAELLELMKYAGSLPCISDATLYP